MEYNPITDKLEITTASAQRAASSAKFALRQIRISAGLSLDKYEHTGLLDDADHAQIAILQMLEHLGINIGVGHMDFHLLDLRGEDDLKRTKQSHFV